jgi:hypothetical protein
VDARWWIRCPSSSSRRWAREMLSARAAWRAECVAANEGWMVEGECVSAFNSSGLLSMSARSCLLDECNVSLRIMLVARSVGAHVALRFVF